MSGFFNKTNYGRVLKMFKMLEGPMAKSAKSNKATPEQWSEMLEPLTLVIDRLRQGAGEEPPSADPEPFSAKPPVEREMTALTHLTTQQLVDRMIACGAILASRRQ